MADPLTVAALFVRADSIYKNMPGVDAWDIERDARKWTGGAPVVAHPPCRAWGQLRQFAKPRPDEKELAPWAVDQCRTWGGVLEHPNGSSLWPALGLPEPGAGPDRWGGWTLQVAQFWWGHRAEKLTKLYIVGAPRAALPPVPLRLDRPTHCIATNRRAPRGERLPTVTKPEREHTPPDFAAWLVEVARIAGAARAA